MVKLLKKVSKVFCFESHGEGPAYGLALTGQIKETIVSPSKEGYSYVTAS